MAAPPSWCLIATVYWKEHHMAGWVDKQIDSWFDRKVDRYVDKKMDNLLKGKMSDDDFVQLKAMTRKGQTLDEATEVKLQEQLGDLFEPYKAIHNGVAKIDRADARLKSIARHLP